MMPCLVWSLTLATLSACRFERRSVSFSFKSKVQGAFRVPLSVGYILPIETSSRRRTKAVSKRMLREYMVFEGAIKASAGEV